LACYGGNVRSGILPAYFVGSTWERFKEARGRTTIQAKAAPTSIGFSAPCVDARSRITTGLFVMVSTTATTAYCTRRGPASNSAAGGFVGAAPI
jgi:hypothetical protein